MLYETWGRTLFLKSKEERRAESSSHIVRVTAYSPAPSRRSPLRIIPDLLVSKTWTFVSRSDGFHGNQHAYARITWVKYMTDWARGWASKPLIEPLIYELRRRRPPCCSACALWRSGSAPARQRTSTLPAPGSTTSLRALQDYAPLCHSMTLESKPPLARMPSSLTARDCTTDCVLSMLFAWS